MSLDRLFARRGIVAITLSLFLIAASTLFPYDFFFKEMAEKFGDRFRVAWVEKASDSRDVLANILLFLPLGFGLTYLTHRENRGRQLKLLVILILGSCLSFTVECLQIFLPTRFTSLTDVLANTIGTSLGFLLFYLRGPKILTYISVLLRSTKRLLNVRILTTTFFGYMVMTFLVTISLQRETSLINWDDTFPLLVGNEQTGNRPWRGHVYQLQIASRALSAKEVTQAFSEKGLFASIEGPLLCSYQLTDGERYHDQSARLPELVWKGDVAKSQNSQGAYLGTGPWLETSLPAAVLTQEIREANQFTLSANVATADTTQTGPARIVSLSRDPDHRNFTLGQEGSHLVFRLRTPLTGENGMQPELIAPNVFATSDLRHVVITYDGSLLRLFVDGVRHSRSLELIPGVTLFSYLFPLNAYDMKGYQALYYGVIFIPLGCLLVLIVKILQWP